MAEETGLMVQIDRWVLREACVQLRGWRERHAGELRVMVDLSARRLTQGGLVEHLEATLAETGVAVDWVRLEITEGVLVGRAEEAVLAELRARGRPLVRLEPAPRRARAWPRVLSSFRRIGRSHDRACRYGRVTPECPVLPPLHLPKPPIR